MKKELILALIDAFVEDAINNESFKNSIKSERGPRGQRGKQGEQGLRGEKGEKGDKGDNPDIEEVRQALTFYLEDLKLKFDDLTDDDKVTLRGPRGQRGKQGEQGFQGIQGEKGERGEKGEKGERGDTGEKGESVDIQQLLKEININQKIKEKFEESKQYLRGPRGQKGKAFSFEEHKENITNIIVSHLDRCKLKFDDLTDDEKDSLKLKFKDLSTNDVEALRLKFDDLTDEQKLSLKGARGQRGKSGRDFIFEENKEEISSLVNSYIESIKPDLKGDTGERGIRGQIGLQGERGFAGKDGKDGKNAPVIVDVEIITSKDSAYMVFTFEDGSTLETNEFDLPKITYSSTQILNIGEGTVGEGAAGAIFVTNVTSSGNTVVTYNESPNNASVKSITTDTFNLRVFVEWDRTSDNYEGLPTVNDVEVIRTARTGNSFVGYADITGEAASINATLGSLIYSVPVESDFGPTVLSAEFVGDYPTGQTELKAGDTFQVSITTDIDADRVEFQDFAALANTQVAVSAGQSFIVNANIGFTGIVATELNGRVRTRTPSGSWGDWFEITNTVICNNLYPSIQDITQARITYPSGQGALKNDETADVNIICSDFDEIIYSSPTSEIEILDIESYEPVKTVTRLSGDYNEATNNYQISATRLANNANTTKLGVVKIANVAATVGVSVPSDRLRSGGNNGTSAQNYTITINSNQLLNTSPILDAPVGNWQGGGFTGSGKTWTRSLQINDDMAKGAYTWGNMLAVNLANIETEVITGDNTYTLGGFVTRVLTLEAFANTVQANVEVANYSKLTLSWSVKGLPNKRSVGTTATPDPDSWAIDALNVNPTTFIILDTNATDSSSQSSTVTVQEVI